MMDEQDGIQMSNCFLAREGVERSSRVNNTRIPREGTRHCGILLGCLLAGTVCAVGSICAGCSGYPYFGDRLKDAGDVVTFSLGLGGGVKARIGPVQVGATVNAEGFLLRGGECLDGIGLDGTDVNFMIIPWKEPLVDGDPETVFGHEWFSGDESEEGRGKRFYALNGIPFVATRVIPLPGYHDAYPYYYFGQVEVFIGLGISLRSGVNVLELVDFLAGWTTLDLLADDVGI